MITSVSPPERFEVCVSRTCFPRESQRPFRNDRIRPPMTRVHVSPLDWEGTGSLSVEARCPAVAVPSSEGVAVPAAQGQGEGLPEGNGRTRTANRHPPRVGPGCCPDQRRRWPPRIVRGPPGPRGHAPSPCGGHGGVSGGPVWPGWATKAVPAGRRVWRPPPLGRLSRAPRWRTYPGGARSDAAGGDGAPVPVYRGGDVVGVGHTGRAVGAPGMAPALWGGCHARPAGGFIQGGRGATPRKATERPCQFTGAHKNGAGGADGGRTGRP